MPPAYIPLLLFSLLVLAFPIVTLIVFKYIRPGSRGGPAKFQPPERGILPETSARGRYSDRFYIIAMLFVIFNVETIFLFPWAVLFRGWLAARLAAFALLPMFVFLGVLLVGYVWLYKKGALDPA
jgi:NADH-quinone oxidoreductase subunit A